MKLRIIGLALSLSLVLTACGGEGDGGGRASFLGRAAGISEEETLLTVDGRAVPGWRYLYWLAAACDQLAEEYRAAGKELDWQAGTEQGTPAQWALRQALADTALYATVENWAERYGCALTESDRQQLDVLSEFEELEICTAYELNGKIIHDFPFTDALDLCKPVFEKVKGWHCDITSCRKFEQLPRAAQDYVLLLEKLCECNIKYISVGAEREQIIVR